MTGLQANMHCSVPTTPHLMIQLTAILCCQAPERRFWQDCLRGEGELQAQRWTKHTWMVTRRRARASCGAPPACLETARPSRTRAVSTSSSRRLTPEENVDALAAAAVTCSHRGLPLRLHPPTSQSKERCAYEWDQHKALSMNGTAAAPVQTLCASTKPIMKH